jgi:RNA polymerase sporulation-specific sigma factor
MPQPKKKATKVKKAEVKRLDRKGADPEVLYYIDLVYAVREKSEKKPVDANMAFAKIVEGLATKIKKIAGKFKIPGFSFDDVYQESLYALRYKAIKDYDETRGSVVGTLAPFDRFALLCIRRHLSTTLKTSQQNKKKILNSCKSLDQDRSNDNDELSLVNIIPKSSGTVPKHIPKDVLDSLQSREYFGTLMTKLLSKLSPLERQVFKLYARQYTYEEIADIINAKYPNSDVNYKGVDNALSRIKAKSHKIFEKIHEKDQKEMNKPDFKI